MMTFRNVWDKTVEQLEQMVTKNALDMWIRTLEPIAYENDAAILMAQSPFQRDIVMSRYKDIIAAAMGEVVGFEMDVDVVTAEERKKIVPSTVIEDHPKVEEKLEKITSSFSHPQYSFENFIVGDSNRHAHAACLAVAQNPSGAYNPLFLHGSTGLGKTHLLYAIQNEIKKLYPEKITLYIRSEDFTNELIENVKRNTMSEFKNKYRSLNVLMVDDIQFIAGKNSTQDEFFHTFNALYEANKQIILVSDRPPRDIQLLEDRLRSRFEMGLITDIYQPEYELKVAIIRQRCQFYGLDLSDEVVGFIAQHVKSNIRRSKGF
jgi:chromosomal replication initiator protein